MRLVLAAVMLLGCAALPGCAVYPQRTVVVQRDDDGPRRRWVPPHRDAWGRWVPGRYAWR